MPHTVKYIVAHQDEFARRFEEYDPRPEDKLDPALIHALRRADTEEEKREAVAAAREGGCSWTLIGGQLGLGCAEVQRDYGSGGGTP